MEKIIITRNIDNIKGLTLIEPKVFSDIRGYFKETYNEKDFFAEYINSVFVQDNEVFSKKGVLRGFHVNRIRPQAKLIHVILGEIFDVVIDLRKDSLTFKKWFGIKLSGKNHKQLFIPEGFAHGYLALQDSYIHFKVTTHYKENEEIGFAWNSKEFGIKWPFNENEIIQDRKDSMSPEFSDSQL